MARPREFPHVPVSYITKLMAGEAHCEWSAWFRSVHFFDKRPGRGDYSTSDHKVKHTKMLRRQKAELEAEGFTVTVEDANDFKVPGTYANLSCKPDIIAIRDDESLIVDLKSGVPYASHELQVRIYMWAVPRVVTRFVGRKFRGLLVYEDDHHFIEHTTLTPQFVSDLGATIRKLVTVEPSHKTPSVRECRFCPVNDVDCKDRVQEPPTSPTLVVLPDTPF